MDLLLLSNSTNHGGTPWAHAVDVARPLVAGRRLLFVPFALADHDGYTERTAAAFGGLAAQVEGLHTFANSIAAVEHAEAVCVGGGNTWRLLATIQRLGLVEPLRQRVLRDGIPYLGASAGTNLACPTIKTTNDMPIVEPESFAALGLIDFQINPHFVDPDPASRHMGETRETRIMEFHEENDVPVVGLREGSWLRVSDAGVQLGGWTARVFRRGQEPQECEPGAIDL